MEFLISFGFGFEFGFSFDFIGLVFVMVGGLIDVMVKKVVLDENTVVYNNFGVRGIRVG